MDRVMATVDPRHKATAGQVLEDLALVSPHCHWTSGNWVRLDMRWNDIQNVPVTSTSFRATSFAPMCRRRRRSGEDAVFLPG